MIATVFVLAYRCHRLPPLPKPLPCAKWRAKDGEVAPLLQSLSVATQVFSRSSSRRDGRCGDRGQILLLAPSHHYAPTGTALAKSCIGSLSLCDSNARTVFSPGEG